MKTLSRHFSVRAMLALFLAATLAVPAQETPPAPERPAPPVAQPAAEPAPAAVPAAQAEAETQAPPAPKAAEDEAPLRRIDETTTPAEPAPETREPRRKHRGGGEDFPFGDHHVPKGSRMGEAVSIFGSTSVDGEVAGDVVSIIGSTRIGPGAKAGGAAVAVLGRLEVEGPVAGEAVGVLGGVRIDASVGGEVVSVLGDLELGPKAVVDGDLVVVGGMLKKDPAAIVRGNVVNMPFFGGFGDLEWLVTWFKRCLLMGRPLAFGANLGWAWLVAASFLAFYLLLALIFPRAVEKCAITLETRPGYSLLASVLTVFLTPVVIVLLAVTVIGAVLVPFVGIGLLCAKFFGKAVMLAWLGRRFTNRLGGGNPLPPVFAVLLGGVIVMLLYTVPVFGFLLYKVLSWLGLGVVVYTIALAIKREKAVKPVPAAAGVPTAAAGFVPPAAQASPFTARATETAATFVPPPTIPPAAGMGGPEAVAFAAAGPGFTPPVMGAGVAAAAAPAISAATLPRAGFLIRMAALLLDVILVGLLLGLMNGLLPRFLEPQPPSILLMLAVYGAVMWKLKGTTIGGIVCGLKVVRLDDREIDWATALVRALGCFLSLFVVGLGFIWVAIDDERQSWHDKIAGTVVVRVPKGVSLL